MVNSPMNNSFSGSKGSRFGFNFMGALIGTGDTIVQDGSNFVNSFGGK